MLKSYFSLFCVSLIFVGATKSNGEAPSRQLCATGVVGELNQSLQEEAWDLKEFLETRKQARLSGRDKVEACSRWSAMSSYAKSMARHYQSSSQSALTVAMVEHLRADLEGNNDCWANPSPVLANMLEGVRVIISRAARIGDALMQSEK